MKVNAAFRRYHRQVAVMMCIPLGLTIITGTAYPIFDQWLSLNSIAGLLLKIHSGRILGLDAIYPVLNGMGLIGLMITGMSMTSLFRKRRSVDESLAAEIRANKSLIPEISASNDVARR